MDFPDCALADRSGRALPRSETNHFRVIQIQLSRGVLANLARKGFDRETFRRKQFVQDQLDFLYYGQKQKWHGLYFGLKFAQLNALSEISGFSICC